jgi:hypothetical protein
MTVASDFSYFGFQQTTLFKKTSKEMSALDELKARM